MKKLELRIRQHQSLFGYGSSISEKKLEKLRQLVIEALSLGLDDKLPASLLRQVGLQSEPNPKVPPDTDDGPPF